MADQIGAHLDRTASPCAEFYRFANGTWLERTAIPPEEAGWGAFHEIRERNLETLREICEEAAGGSAADPAVRKVGDLYASGMDEDGIERAGAGPLAEDLARIEALRAPEALPALLAVLHARRVNAPFALLVLPDAKDSDRYLVQLQQAGLGLPDRDYYVRDDDRSRALREEYRSHVRRMFALLGDAEERAAAGADLVLRLETRLAEASMTRVNQRDPYRVYNPRHVSTLASDAPGLDWSAYLGALGGPRAQDVNLRQPDFFREAAAMLRDVPLAEWRTYLRWHVAHASAPYLSTAFEDESFSFFGRTLTGAVRLRPRWKRVVEAVDQSVPEVLGRLYVERVFPPEAKRRVVEMVEHLRAELRERIRSLEWMTETTKQQALAKLDRFRVKMGYPDRWRDYSGLVVERSAYATNVWRALRWEFDRQLRRLGGPVDRDEWRMSPPTVNAYYSPPGNEIVFPAGILRPPFFDVTADDALNYGGIGVVIGHEMTHGFDDAGSRYDAEGELREWWTPADRAAYESRTDLMVRQYEEYEPLPGLRLNGKLTLGENIADLGGLKVAHAAFRRSLANGGAPPPLEGFSPAQRFFLGFAQSWRSRTRDEQIRLRVYTDPHSPPEFRVLGPLSNLPEFFEAFGCDGAAVLRPVERRPAIW